MAKARYGVLLGLVVALAVAGEAPSQDKDKKGGNTRVSDVPLVERLLAARKEYQHTLEALRKHYIKVGDVERARWAEDELKEYHLVKKQVYILELDVPPPTLKPGENDAEANKLYRTAMEYKDKGWGTEYIHNQRRAEILLQRLLTEYPQSNKISDAAFQLGDLYESKAFQQLHRAAAYYERCFQWNKATQFDARIRAARLYERKLNNRGRAAEIYKEIITHETNSAHIDEARKRLQELGAKR
jgi:hypothetical protein